MRDLVEKGYDLIPVNGKLPLCKWKDPIPIKKTMYLVRQFHGQIAIHTGRSGIVVIDCDDQEALHYARANFPPSNQEAETSRGRHFYYKGIAPLIRGYRGMHLDILSGESYVVKRKFSKEILPVSELNEWPSGLIVKEEPVILPLVSTKAESVRAYISKIVAVSGQRGHASTFRVACRLADAGLSEEEVLGELLHWNETNANPKWDKKALEHKAKDAVRRPK